MTKAELRKIYLDRQKNISFSAREKNSKLIADLFFGGFDLDKINFLHCFLPIEKFNEIDTKPIFHRIWQDFPHIETLVPRIDFQSNELESPKFTPATELVQNAWLIHEPARHELVESEKIDLVLIPLLCFDRRGFRVGYGKGFYDRFLSRCRPDCLKIGLSYFPPVAEISDVETHDVKLDFCLTPEKNFETR